MKAGENMTHKHSVYDTDKHFIVDALTRTIASQSKKTRLMQYDHNSERFTFQVPRYIDGHGMSLCDTIDIHYINISADTLHQSTGPYRVDDMQISPDSDDVIVFSWLISGNATTYAGTLTFAISFKCLTESTIDYAWHTDAYTGIEIVSTVRTEGSEIILEYHDVIAKWERDLFGEGESAVQRIKEAEEKAIKAIEEAGGGSGGGVNFEVGDKLSLVDGILNVKTADEVSEDNTLPVTSAAVHSTVGNIEILLKTI